MVFRILNFVLVFLDWIAFKERQIIRCIVGKGQKRNRILKMNHLARRELLTWGV